MSAKKIFISLLTAIFNVLILLVVLLIFGNKTVINKNTYDDKENFYSIVNSEFILYGLSSEQIEEYSNFDNVEYIASYYKYSTDIKVLDDSFGVPIAIYSGNGYDKSPFSDERLAVSAENVSNPVYIDQQLSEQCSLKLGDKLKLKLGREFLEVTVASIYKTNYLDDYHLMINYNDYANELTNIFEKFEFSHSYINARNVEEFDAYLKDNYAPKAFMYTREDFETDIEYALYLKNYFETNFYNSSYIERIVPEDYSALLDEYKSNLMISLVVMAVVILVLGIIITLLYRSTLNVAAEFSNDFVAYSLIHYVSLVITIAGGVLLFIYLPSSYSSLDVNPTLQEASIILIPVMIVYFVFSILSELIKIFVTYKTLSN